MSDPYLVIEAECAHDLAASVSRHVRLGYRCQGGMAVATTEQKDERKGYSETRTIYAQAMVLASADDVLGEAVEWETTDGLHRTRDPAMARFWKENSIGMRAVRGAKPGDAR